MRLEWGGCGTVRWFLHVVLLCGRVFVRNGCWITVIARYGVAGETRLSVKQ